MDSNLKRNQMIAFLIIAWFQYTVGSQGDTGLPSFNVCEDLPMSSSDSESSLAFYGQQPRLGTNQALEEAFEEFNSNPVYRNPGSRLVLSGGATIIRLATPGGLRLPLRASILEQNEGSVPGEEFGLSCCFSRGTAAE